mgnify:CR=1 FL=1
MLFQAQRPVNTRSRLQPCTLHWASLCQGKECPPGAPVHHSLAPWVHPGYWHLSYRRHQGRVFFTSRDVVLGRSPPHQVPNLGSPGPSSWLAIIPYVPSVPSGGAHEKRQGPSPANQAPDSATRVIAHSGITSSDEVSLLFGDAWSLPPGLCASCLAVSCGLASFPMHPQSRQWP